MNKYLILIFVNIMITILFYVCGVIVGASFVIFEWPEGCRVVVSLLYGSMIIMSNTIIITDYD